MSRRPASTSRATRQTGVRDRDDEHGRERKERRTGGQPVKAIDQIERIRDPDEPGHREGKPDPVPRLITPTNGSESVVMRTPAANTATAMTTCATSFHRACSWRMSSYNPTEMDRDATSEHDEQTVHVRRHLAGRPNTVSVMRDVNATASTIPTPPIRGTSRSCVFRESPWS